MPFDPLRSQKEALEREQRNALLAERNSQIAALTSPAEADMARFRVEREAGTSATGIGGGAEEGPQLRAIVQKFREMQQLGGMGFGQKGGFSPENPYVARANAFGRGAQLASLESKAQGGLSATPADLAFGRAANDALAYELSKRALEERLAPLNEKRARPRALDEPRKRGFVRVGGPS